MGISVRLIATFTSKKAAVMLAGAAGLLTANVVMKIKGAKEKHNN